MKIPHMEPCPFCGRNRVERDDEAIVDGDGRWFWALCPKCFAQGPRAKTERGAVRLWNKLKREAR